MSRVRSRGKEEQEQEARGRKKGQEARRDEKSLEQETRREEQKDSLSLDSRDYSLLSEEVERLQRQIEGMDQDRKVYQAATIKLVRHLHLHLHLHIFTCTYTFTITYT